MNDLVSIIMPTYKCGRFIEESIKSVQTQTCQNWELIIVDDCSEDGTSEIVMRLKEQDERISLYHNAKNSGAAVTRNAALRHAKGRWIAFLDSDDMWLPSKLAQQLPMFQDNRTAVVYSNYEKIDEKGKRSARIVIAPPQVDYNKMLYSNYIGNLTGIFDVRKVGKNYFRQIRHEDYAFWLSVLKSGYIARSTQTITALYRVRSSSLSANKLRLLSWQWNILRNVEHISFFRAIGFYITYAYNAFFKNMI
jgi:glycosyltransferase involved in cell wall biosynthesis